MNKTITQMIEDLLDWGFRPEEIAAKTETGIMTIYRWKAGKTQAHRNNLKRVERLWRYEKGKKDGPRTT